MKRLGKDQSFSEAVYLKDRGIIEVSSPFLFFAQGLYRAGDKVWNEMIDQMSSCYALLGQRPAWDRKRAPVALTF